MIDFVSEDMRRNPYPLYQGVRDVTPVMQAPGLDLWMVFDYEGVRRALDDHEAFSSRASPGGGPPLEWMIFQDPPRHTKLRAIVNRAFTPRVVAGLEPRIRRLSRELLDPVLERGEMDLVADYSAALPLMVIAEMLGIPAEERAVFRRWAETILNLAETISGGEAGERAAREFSVCKQEMRGYLRDLLAERRAAPKEDLLTRLAEAEVDGERLGEDELLGFFQLLLLAGSETTTNLISSAVLSFVENPDQLARLTAEPGLVPSAVEEVLRHRSPVQAVFRKTLGDVEMHGVTIPERKLVLAMIGSANRDSKVFPDAERFDVGRDPNPHIAFGHSLHFCLGAPLARLEGRIAIADLLEVLPTLELTGSDPWEPRRAFHVHGPSRLPVRFAAGRRASAPA